ncbi:competence protein CoiA [Staphylococcus edaphicus]|uniref:Competence protein n=1 Tax=Staphylococcus edaphicus TaxID=1955013 RepID=A0A2C6U7S3_9STAP|nr:competence protein CoiA family protein [Staphylococcus edaphicus]PHK49852.1 competence protein [Staphylococcus edaphicus]UQW80827.1 competence protein [Staphylococcus edaphicus]
MLLAYNTHNQLVYAKHAVKEARYECPHCRSRLVLKKGLVKMPHFSHLGQSSHFCNKGESLEHYNLKYELATRLSYIGYRVQIEPYIAECYQYPDLIINGRIAIEIQLSKMTLAHIKKRSHGLLSSGYKLIWIVPDPGYDKATNIVKLTKYERTFIDIKSKQLVVWNLSEKQLYIYQIYHFLGGNRFVAYKTKLTIKGFGFIFNQSNLVHCVPEMKLSEHTIQQYLNRCRCKHSVKEESLSVIYNLRLSEYWVCKALGFIYPEQLYIQSHPIYWQLQLIYMLVKKPQELNQFNKKIVFNYFYNSENNHLAIVNELIAKFKKSYDEIECNNVQI